MKVSMMKSQLIGYFPKKHRQDKDTLKAIEDFEVQEICSASTCFFEEPNGWIEQWKHNSYLLYNTPDIAHSIIRALSDKNEYDLYAFKQYPIKIEDGEIINETIVCNEVTPLSEEFVFLGYDAVSKHLSDDFGCSPLSCNSGAETMDANEFCLFTSFEDALAGAKEFSKGNWEPGPYYIVEVYRQRKV
jgi:hypothetical protein